MQGLWLLCLCWVSKALVGHPLSQTLQRNVLWSVTLWYLYSAGLSNTLSQNGQTMFVHSACEMRCLKNIPFELKIFEQYSQQNSPRSFCRLLLEYYKKLVVNLMEKRGIFARTSLFCIRSRTLFKWTCPSWKTSTCCFNVASDVKPTWGK